MKTKIITRRKCDCYSQTMLLSAVPERKKKKCPGRKLPVAFPVNLQTFPSSIIQNTGKTHVKKYWIFNAENSIQNPKYQNATNSNVIISSQ